ncbi:MAG TPA: NAD(P)-dependent oxidoreductase [Acidimicrobiia bacterium]
MHILLADRFPPSVAERIGRLGHVCHEKPDLVADELRTVISGYDILVVRSTPVTSETIAASDVLSLVIRAGAGTNTIDVDAAAKRGIYVSNVPGRGAVAVAELTMGLIIAIDRSIPDGVLALRQGRWDKQRFSQAAGLYGRSLGVVGVGDIGLAVAERAAAFGMRLVVVEKPSRSEAVLERLAQVGARTVPSLERLAEVSHVVTFHVPAAEDTRGIIGPEFLRSLRPGAVVINTSRGDLIDEEALLQAMDAKGIRCGIDAFPDEPEAAQAPFRSRLASHPNVYGTHHIGASTEQAQLAIADEMVRIIELFGQGTVVNVVNLERTTLGTTTLSVRHYDEVGVLSEVFAVLRAADINIEQMTNRIFAGARAAVATMHVTGHVSVEVLEALRDITPVLHVTAIPAP